ncbi:hypothetical protein Pelo_17626 [Pelomyxa schiedti]|nr:hypothetical protein Pelo_17626 [Pelomyxa schiedti]
MISSSCVPWNPATPERSSCWSLARPPPRNKQHNRSRTRRRVHLDWPCSGTNSDAPKGHIYNQCSQYTLCLDLLPHQTTYKSAAVIHSPSQPTSCWMQLRTQLDAIPAEFVPLEWWRFLPRDSDDDCCTLCSSPIQAVSHSRLHVNKGHA